MKQLITLLWLALLSNSVLAKSLEHCSIILWPKYDWLGSSLETVADQKLRDGDFIVYPGTLGMKGWFRSDKYQINKARVMMQLTSGFLMGGYKYDLEKHQYGIGGYFVKEHETDGELPYNAALRRNFHQYLHENGQQLAYCMSREITDRVANLRFMSDKCDQLVLYFDRALILDPERSVSYFKNTLTHLENRGSDLKVFAGIELKLDDSSIEEILNLFEAISADIDGIVLVFEGTESQKQTAVRLLQRLRA